MLQKITQLSEFAIKNIVENSTVTLPLYIQLIQLLDSKVSSKVGRISKCKCSDGFASLDLQIINLDESVEQYLDDNKPIIQVNEFKTKEKLCIITQYQVQYTNSKLVGQPIDFQLYQQMNYHNPQGSSQIILFQIKQNFKLKQIKQLETQFQKHENQILLDNQFLNNSKQKQQFNIDNNSDFKSITQLVLGQRNFKFKGRVISKSHITQFKSGKGKLFQIEILDFEKSQIQGIFFNHLCDKFFDKIQIGKVYLFEKGLIKQNPQQNNIQSQTPYQIHFEDYSDINELLDDQTIETLFFDLKKICEIDLIECESKVDIQKFDIVAFRGLKISEYQGNKSLVFTNQSIYELKISVLEKLPNYPEFIKFFNQNKDKIKIQPNLKTINMTSFIKQIQFDFSQNLDIKFQKFYEIRGYITFISTKNNMSYPSCELCNRKVIQNNNNKQFFCQNCEKLFDQPQFKYFFSLTISDTSGSLQCIVSHAPGLMILKQCCDKFQLMTLFEKDDLIKKATYQNYRFFINGKVNYYNSELCSNFYIVNLIQDNYLQESIHLIEKIQQQSKT